MVCFVHDRQFLSKFHAAVNQLRRTNEFPVTTLRQLPKQSCSCPEKRTDKKFTAVEPILSSIDIDALRVICLWLELKRSVATNAVAAQSKPLDCIVLPFPASFEPEDQAIISNQFLVQNDNRLRLLQQIHHVHFQFVISASSEELNNQVIQLKCDLIAKCSTYLEAIQAINGLWIIMTTNDESHIDIVKRILQQYWKRFIMTINTHYTHVVYDWRQNLSPQVTDNKCSRRKRSVIRYRNLLNRQEEIKQAIQRKRIVIRPTRRNAWARTVSSEPSEDESEEISTISKSGCWFLSNKYQEFSKYRLSRFHRRQQILAFAILA